MPTVYPIVPGHEIVGRVTKVGSAVTKFKAGDLAAVGCMVDSDGTCAECRAGLEQYCPNMTLTYNSPDKHLGGVTYGGYSESIVVDERFVLRVPANLEPRRRCAAALRRDHDLLAAAPLGGRQGQEGRRGRARRTRSHGREVCARASARTSWSSRLRPTRKKTRCGSARTKSWFRAMPTRCRSTRAASTSSSTRSRRSTTSTPTSTCCAATASSRWSARRRSRCRSRPSR